MSMRGSGEDAYWVDATGAGWLTLPITLHSSRMPMCDLTPQQCAFELQHWLNWYEADHQYALPTVAFILAIVLFFAIGALGDLVLPRAVQRWTVIRRMRASARFLAYKSFRIPFLRWYSSSLGIILIGALGFVFFMAMTLGRHPYYWPNTEETNYGSSPPIATRSGWMSLACLPFILVLAAKENPISVLTRIAYEKLNVFHRWLSWAMYALALVHTFPFIVYHRKEGDMGMQWGMSAYYWTGVIAILAQSWLTFFSFGPIRNRFYEVFKATHLLAAAMFFAFLFIHVGFTLSSVDYMIAAAVLYFVCWVAASLRTAFEHGPRPVSARLEMLPHDVLKISIPTKSSWKPGQHIFLRFLSWNVHSLTAHPFTISSLPRREGSSTPRNKNEMIFYVHPRGGYTGRLAALARQNPDCRVNVSLDGPYGGMKDRSLGLFDKAVIISGGAGAGFMLPVLEDLLRMKAAKEEIDVKIVFCTRNDEHATWFCEQIAALLERYRATGAKVEVHVTGGAGMNVVNRKLEGSNNDEADTGKEMIEEERKVGSDSESEDFAMLKRTGRPNAKAIVAQAVEGFGGTLGIAACGPEDLLFEVRNAVADAQKNIGPHGPDDVYLYSEQFGW